MRSSNGEKASSLSYNRMPLNDGSAGARRRELFQLHVLRPLGEAI